jgi:DnaJ-class molecular chaperone
MNKFKFIAGEKVKKSEQPECCDYCDGVGWVEGGEALQTTCPTCKGAGIKLTKSEQKYFKPDEFEGGIFP